VTNTTLLTGWRTWFVSFDGDVNELMPPSTTNEPIAASLGSYLAESLRERAPTLYADDLERGGQRVLVATTQLAAALVAQRERYVRTRDDDARALIDSLVTLVAGADGASLQSARARYARVRTPSAAPTVVVVESVALAECVIVTWRRVFAELLPNVPGVAVTSVGRRDVAERVFATYRDVAAHDWFATIPTTAPKQTTIIENLVDIEYHDELHEAAARQGLAPLVDAVRLVRLGDVRVRVDWTLLVATSDSVVHASLAFRAYAVP